MKNLPERIVVTFLTLISSLCAGLIFGPVSVHHFLSGDIFTGWLYAVVGFAFAWAFACLVEFVLIDVDGGE